jgi:hypothetical protein
MGMILSIHPVPDKFREGVSRGSTDLKHLVLERTVARRFTQ